MSWNDVDLRFIAARGVEYRENWSSHWKPVTGELLARMTARELRRIADVMDPPQRTEDGSE